MSEAQDRNIFSYWSKEIRKISSKAKRIRYAQPPVGQLRLKPPQTRTPPKGLIGATQVAPTCPQFDGPPPVFPDAFTQLMLTLNVIRPPGTKQNAKLPVMFWIHGGGFQVGSGTQYDGTTLVSTSVTLGKPLIYVAINYQVLADGSANLSLRDQRLALDWIVDNIAASGGNPHRVMLWGESVDSFSVNDQLALYAGNNTYKGKPIFHGAIMNSGTILPADPVDTAKAQDIYDTVVEAANCAHANNTLDCPRDTDYDTFVSVAISYPPRPDGKVVVDSGEVLVQTGRTLFSFTQSNVSNTNALVDYFPSAYYHLATESQLRTLIEAYPDSIPLIRQLLWSYLAGYNHGTPVLGTFHGSDLLPTFFVAPQTPASKSLFYYYTNFAYSLDPNGSGEGDNKYLYWPKWNEGKKLLHLSQDISTVLADDFRCESYDWISKNIKLLRL
ncbi:hypothetical protein OIDMADRAFT_44926 [Oidiodendron maius Zn]|uniref:Carboxylesterase type B domain-containing protein n=1 Tax=Oidiodendron maius (strain Zn) TaxID=913774 RepID=A0A0C3D2T1_OIDMZ|nr:hypothetical protein OIDMADRAFT_44926 [Oidiodendron maius Zn]